MNDLIELDDNRGPWCNRAMACPCGKTWTATAPVDAVMPMECPACGEMKGMPERVRVAVTIEGPRALLEGHSLLGFLYADKLVAFLEQDGIMVVGAEKVAFPEPEVESCGHDTAPQDPIECCYDTELGHEPPKMCRCCPECAHECYTGT
jgi:hypothetical protein